MQTAMGVAGGVLLGNAIGGLFANHAEAAPADSHAMDDPSDAPADASAMDMQQPDASMDDGGGFFDGFGDDF